MKTIDNLEAVTGGNAAKLLARGAREAESALESIKVTGPGGTGVEINNPGIERALKPVIVGVSAAAGGLGLYKLWNMVK